MKRVLLLLLFAGFSANALERADMQVTDLAADAHLLLEGERIMVLVLTRSDCHYCHGLMKGVILPLLRSGVWNEKVIFRELELDTSPEILDFESKSSTALEFASRYGPTFTPSILFLDRCGREVGARHAGYDGGDFFEFYLQKSVDQARAWLKKNPADCPD